MKSTILFVLLIIGSINTCAQDYSRNQQVTIFTDSTNLREKPSLDGKILTALRHGTELIVCEKGHETDTINGKWGVWVPVIHNNLSGYVWKNTLCDLSTSSKNGNTLLARNSDKGLAYKIIKGKNLISNGVYPDSARTRYSYITKMDISNTPEEIFSFRIVDSPILYAFDGTKVFPNGKCNLNEISDFHNNLTKEFTDSLGALILKSNADFRIAPNSKSELLESIPLYSFVATTKATPRKDTVNDQPGLWHRVKWKNKVGFVWSEDIAFKLHHIYDHQDTSLSYLLTTQAIAVLKNRQPIAHVPIPWHTYDNHLHSFGDMGFGLGWNFIAMEFVAHSCGQTSGDQYFLWDGETIKFFCFSSGVGDGSFSEMSSYVFPKSHNRGDSLILHHSSSSESIDIIPANECETRYTDVDYFEHTAVMQFLNDTLVEIDSEHLRAKQFIEAQLPNQNPIKMLFHDINQDGLIDLIFQATSNTQSDQYYDYGETNNQDTATLGIAFATDDKNFKFLALNKNLLTGKSDKRIRWQIGNGVLTLTTFYIPSADRYDDYPAYGRINYEFKYDPSDGKFYWKMATVINKEGVQNHAFKSKKIAFENAWPFEVPDEY